MKKAIVIDGNSLIYRMFYATYSLAEYSVQHNLQPVNALKLMIETMFRLLKNNYSYCLVAFDHGKRTIRHDIFEQYKSGRKKMPPELISQIPLIKEAIGYMGVNIISQEGIEADDFIGSFAKLMSKNNIHVDIYSSDKDMLQLVDENINVNILKTGLTNQVIYSLSNFADLYYGLKPCQVIDFKGIVGDKSDNIPGVKGIGLKTCINLLTKYEYLENIYDNINELSDSVRSKFLEYKDVAFMSKKIATIDTNIFINNSVDEFIFKSSNYSQLNQMIKKYNINGLDKYFKNINEQIKLF